MNKILMGNYKKKLFIITSVLILSLFLVFFLFFQDIIYKPSTCHCAKIFSLDSTVSLPAAKRLVGGGHYVYTLQTARKNCIDFYEKDINKWKAQQHKKEGGFNQDSSFFVIKCQEK